MAQPITPLQLRALQTLWAAKMRAAGIGGHDDARELRHQYIAHVTSGRANSTKELSRDDARRVIDLLSREQRGLAITDATVAQAAGTHGRRGHDDGRTPVLIGAPQLALLARLQSTLGWDQVRLDGFIARQLQGRKMRTMGQFNAVVWAMKRMARQAQK